MRRIVIVVLAVVVTATLAGCGDDGGGDAAGDDGTTPAREEVAAPPPTQLALTARDYSFDVPPSFPGGVVEVDYRNTGSEAHFAAFAAVAEGVTVDDVLAVVNHPPPPGTSVPAGAPPPPFVDEAGMGMMDPGAEAHGTVRLPPGRYVLYCNLPSPDGSLHTEKGMVTEVIVTAPEQEEATSAPLTDVDESFIAGDFILGGGPDLDRAGRHVVGLRNKGKQLHEIDLVELADGKTVDDVAAWFAAPAGPPPMRLLGGPAVKPGEEATAVYDLRAGVRYAFVCTIPDFLGDFALHVTKGMHTAEFTVA